MKTSMRKNLAILFLSGTTALAGPVFAQQVDPANPLPLPEGQGSAQTEGSVDTNAGAAEGGAGASTQAQTPESGAVEQNSAQGSGAASGEAETQTSQKPVEGKVRQDAAQSTTESETKSQTSASTPNTEETNDSAQSAPSNETTASIDVTTEQRTEIHNIIKESDAKPVDIDIDVNIGTVVPRTIELRPLPSRIIEIVPAYRTYKYVLLANGTILIIEPSSLKIVYVIAA